jgi:hypothetical protein
MAVYFFCRPEVVVKKTMIDKWWQKLVQGGKSTQKEFLQGLSLENQTAE